MNLQAGLVRREEMVELQRTLSEHVNLNDALRKRNLELEVEVKDLADWQEELTQNAIEAEKDFNVKQRLWTEENSILQSRNRSLAEERDRKDQEVSEAKEQLRISQQAAKQSEAQLNKITMAYRELKAAHEGLPERYETARQAAREAADSIAGRDTTIQALQAQLTAKQVELDALSGSAGGRAAQLQQDLDAEQQQHQKAMDAAQLRWEQRLTKVQGEKVMAEDCVVQIKGELRELQERLDSMHGEVQHRDDRSSELIQKLEADVAHEKQQAAQAQAAVKQLEEQLEQLRATATQAEAAMKAAQAEAAASGERVKLQEQTGAQCTEEAMHVAAAADVQMQLQREREVEVARREKQVEAKEALMGKEFEQREAAMEGHIRAAEEVAATRVAEAESQVAAVKAELEQERQERCRATDAMTQQQEAVVRAAKQRQTALEEQLAALKRGAGSAEAAGHDGKENAMDVDGANTNGEALGARRSRRSGRAAMQGDLQATEREREMEEHREKLRRLVENIAAAQKELDQARKNLQHVLNEKEELEGVNRSLQQEELALRTKLTQQKSAQKIGALAPEEVPAHVVVSGGRRDSDPVPFGSPRAADAPFGSPATLAVDDEAAAVTQNGAGLFQGGHTPSKNDAGKSDNKATPAGTDPSHSPAATPPGKGLLGGLFSRATGIFGGSTRPHSGSTPALLADDTQSPADRGSGARAGQGAAEVELAPPGWQEAAKTPRFGGARTSSNAGAKQQLLQQQQNALGSGDAAPGGDAASPKIRSAKVSPEGTARLAARAQAAAADAAAKAAGADAAEAGAAAAAAPPTTRRAAGSGTGSGGAATRRGSGNTGAAAAVTTSALPKRPLSGSKRRRGAGDGTTEQADVAEADGNAAGGAGEEEEAAVGDGGDAGVVADKAKTSPQRTRRLNTAAAGAGRTAGRTKTGIARPASTATAAAAAESNAKKGDAVGVATARRRVADKAKKDATASGRTSSRIASVATPVGAADGGGTSAAAQQVTPPKISAGAAPATRAGSAATQERRRKRAGAAGADDARSGATSASRSGLSGAGTRRAAAPAAKKRAVARDANGAGGSATGTTGARAGAARGGLEPITIETSPEPPEAAAGGDAAGEGEPSTPHGKALRLQHLVEEAAGFTGCSPAELQAVNEGGAPMSARALRASSRAQSRSTMTPGRGVEDGEEAEGGSTPQLSAGRRKSRSRRAAPPTRGRNLHEIQEGNGEDDDEPSGGEEEAE